MSSSQQNKMDLTQQEEEENLPPSDKKDDERYIEELRLKYNFWKFLLGSVVVVLITAILNFAIGWTQLKFDQQQKQQELEVLRLQNERAFLAKFIEQAMDVNLEARIRFSHYFASLTNPEGEGERWKNYHNTLLATATSESSELAIKKATAIAIEVEYATATAQTKVTATYVAKQLEENPVEFAPTATQIAKELSEQNEKLQETQLEVQLEVQRLENELTRQVTPTPIATPTEPFNCESLVTSSRSLQLMDTGNRCWFKLSDGSPAELAFNQSAQITFAIGDGRGDRYFFIANPGDGLSNVYGATIRSMSFVNLQYGGIEQVREFETIYHNPGGGFPTCLRDWNNSNSPMTSLCQ